MRSATTADKLERLMQFLGRECTGPGRIYITGGGSAVLLGWRSATVDVDLRLDPEPPGAFDAIPRAKRELDINIELASPADFIPPPPGWRGRSRLIDTFGGVAFYHYDFVGQALSKIERGHQQDLADVREMLARRLVTPDQLREQFDAIEPELKRYPAIDPPSFRRAVEELLRDAE